MKRFFLIIPCIIILSCFMFITACDKEDEPINEKDTIKVDPFSGKSGTFVDKRDGHTYKWIKVGTQIWMAENLAYKPENYGSGAWAYNNDTNYVKTFGYLYDFYTANTSCPEGWHIPSDSEWNLLTKHLDPNADTIEFYFQANIAGEMLKDTGTLYWLSPNPANNKSGLSCLPGGKRDSMGNFTGLGIFCIFWSSTSSSGSYAWIRGLTNEDSDIQKDEMSSAFSYGASVRCIKD